MARLRSTEHAFLRDEALVASGEGHRLWNFAGGRANLLLARVLEERLGERVTASNLHLGFSGKAGESAAGIRQAQAALREAGRPDGADALRYAQGISRGRLSKFQACLPAELEARYLAEALLGEEAARRG